NDNIREVIVSYQIIDKAVGAVTGQKGTLTINANGNRSLGIKAPTNGSINFFMGASNFAQIITATNGVCLVKNGTKTVEIGTKVDQYAIFENKAYDARNWDWFVRKEKVPLKDKFGKLATDSDKGVSLKDLTTITNETNLFVASQTGAIGFTHAVGYFRIVDNKPVEPQIINWKISNMSSGSGVVQGTIPANSKIGFFLVASNANVNPLIQNPNSLVRFVGTTLQYSTTNGASWIDIPQGKVVTTVKEWNTNQKEMAIAGIAVENNKTVLKIGFEDNTGSGSDWDYEDHVLTVHFNGIEAIKTKESKILQTVDHLVEVPCADCPLGSISGEELLYEALKCDEISCNKDANGNIIVENKNSKAVTVNYKVVINGKENSKGAIKVGGQSSVLFNQPAPVNGYISFGIGSNYFTSVINGSNILGDVCLVADGKKFISAGEREVQYEVFEGKTYDAREWAWFVRQE
ncbi:MAG: DUF4114 domain-containing protein, partial [Bacteroidetes bacterium]